MRKMQFRVLLLALLLCGIGIVLFLWLHPKQKPATNSLPIFYRLPEESDRQAFLTEQHYTLHSGNAVRSCPVLIPDENENSSVYQSYWTLQTEQKLPLSAFCGCQGIEYTYSLQTDECISLLLSEDGLLLAAVRYDATDPQTLLPVIQSGETSQSPATSLPCPVQPAPYQTQSTQ